MQVYAALALFLPTGQLIRHSRPVGMPNSTLTSELASALWPSPDDSFTSTSPNATSTFSEYEAHLVWISQLPMCGIHVSRISGHILVAMPAYHRIAVYTHDTLRQLASPAFSFAGQGFRPAYLTEEHAPSLPDCTMKLWASCPIDGRLLLIDPVTGQFNAVTPVSEHSSESAGIRDRCESHVISNGQMKAAVDADRVIRPTHVVQTTDGRILFLDPVGQRLYWVMRSHTRFVHFQRIRLSTAADDAWIANKLDRLVGLQALPCEMVMLAGRHRVYILKPARCLDGSPKSLTHRCSLL
ncbi:unnamed protein product [Protopolystoma xenopodis]|uniref:Uncharacterized protein n=1 Tax=Protopolystoma xenopodis TaxID=117903 RepID=A0A448WDH3_9PLAT|nr:unnamed protein product [Protopolystoma xenopodis]